MAADRNKGPTLLERWQPRDVARMRRVAVDSAEQTIAARARLVVHEHRESARRIRQMQPRAALPHVIACTHPNERVIVQLIQRVVERVLLSVEEPFLPQLLVQRGGGGGEARSFCILGVELPLRTRIAVLEEAACSLLHGKFRLHLCQLCL
eukprot:4533253-Prymnesium_polylepis.1